MKFLFMSGAGDGAGIAFQLRQEGHDVSIWIRESHSKENFDGLLRKVKSWESALDRDTVVVFDSNGGGRTADRIRARGHYVLVGSTFADVLERDSTVGLDAMREAGIKTPGTERFASWSAAERFVTGEPSTRWFFKPLVDMGPRVTPYESSGSEDLLETMAYFQKVTEKGKDVEFLLQETVGGLCMWVEGWFNGNVFVQPFLYHFVATKALNGNLGPMCECAGSVSWASRVPSRITDTLAKAEMYLREADFVGPIALKVIVTPEDVYGVEWRTRFGYDTTPAVLQELYAEAVGDFFGRVAQRTYPNEVKLRDGFAASVHISVPPYPIEQFRGPAGIPIRGWERGHRPHLYFYDVKLDDANLPVTTSAYGNIAAGLGYGETVDMAMFQAYEIAYVGRIPNKQYRTDLKDLFQAKYKSFLQLTKGEEEALIAPSEQAS